jgi:hypothetical protein
MTGEEILAAIRASRQRIDSEIYGLHALVINGRIVSVDPPLQLADLAAAAGLPVSAIRAVRMTTPMETSSPGSAALCGPDDPA